MGPPGAGAAASVFADLFAKVNCTYCQEEINGVRVQCCECADFDICLQCFSCGAEIGPHKNDHSYRFVDHLSVSIFGGRGNWTGREELQLLDATYYYGFGNWEYISQSIETRTAEEVKEEFTARYLDGNIGKAVWNEIWKELGRPNLPEHTSEDRGPLSPDVTARLPPLDVTPEEARQLGYMTFRDDFEREHDAEAEALVSSLQLTKEDSEMDSALKLAHIDMYTRRLRERCRRKRIVRDYQLVAKFFNAQRSEDGGSSSRGLSKEQTEFRDKMKVFCQFLTSGEHERLIESIERERELRLRLSELLKYRSLGITSQEEIIHFEQHAAYQRQQEMRQSKAGSSGYGTTALEQLLENGKSGETDQSSIEGRCMALQDVDDNNSSCSSSGFSSNSLQPPQRLLQTPPPMPSSSSAGDAVAATVPAALQPPPVTSLPHGQQLSQHEVQLCTSLNLMPLQYRTLKSIIIQDNLLSNGKTGAQLTDESLTNGGELSVKDIVAKYLSVSGWLPSVSVI